MAESTLTLQHDDLAEEIAWFLGYARSRNSRSTDENTEVDDILDKGYSLFMFPPWADAQLPNHLWTFLKYDTTLTMTADSATVDCPDGFGVLLAGQLFYTDSDTGPSWSIKVRSQDFLHTLFQEDDDYSGDPEYCCIRPKVFAAATGQRWQVRWYPIPDTAHVVTFPYLALADQTSGTNYLRGGMLHQQTLLAACRAMAELHSDDEKGKEWAHYLTCVRSSYSLDVRNLPAIAGDWRDYDTRRVGTMTDFYIRHGIGATIDYDDS